MSGPQLLLHPAVNSPVDVCLMSMGWPLEQRTLFGSGTPEEGQGAELFHRSG
jgi:hypothetical protein